LGCAATKRLRDLCQEMHAFFRAENVSALQKAQFTAEHLPEPVMSPHEAARGSIDRFDLYPARLLGDSAYGSAEMLGWLVYEHGIAPQPTVVMVTTAQ